MVFCGPPFHQTGPHTFTEYHQRRWLVWLDWLGRKLSDASWWLAIKVETTVELGKPTPSMPREEPE